MSIGTGQIAVFLPFLSLPQKNGKTLILGYFYGNNTWTIKQTNVHYSSYSASASASISIFSWLEDGATYEYKQNQTGRYSGRLNLNIPSLSAGVQYIGADNRNTSPSQSSGWVGSYCVTNWTFTDWQGSAHSFSGYQDCDQAGGILISAYGSHVVPEAPDDSGFRLDTSVPGNLRVVDADGTVYHFSGYTAPSPQPQGSNYQGDDSNLAYYRAGLDHQVDTSGNQITIANGVMTDTTGRQIQISPIGIKSGISWQSSGNPASVTLAETATGQAGSFPPDWLPFCQAKDASVYAGSLGSYSGWHGSQVNLPQPPAVMSGYSDTVTLPDGTYYRLDYDSTSRLIKIRYPEGGYTRYEYGIWNGVTSSYTDDGDAICLRPKIAVTAKHVCTDAHGACSQSP